MREKSNTSKEQPTISTPKKGREDDQPLLGKSRDSDEVLKTAATVKMPLKACAGKKKKKKNL